VVSPRIGLAAGVAVTSLLFAMMHLSPALLLV
jgi:membrane protease YdiL (CAAX protease family)